MPTVQHVVKLPEFPRGCHLITKHIGSVLSAADSGIRTGICHIFIQHTSASLTINENSDPAVRSDLNRALDWLVPETWDYQHVDEGTDDMPAHVKASLMGSGLMIPVGNGRLLLGTWQGIYLNEHRNHGGSRSLVVTLMGD